MLYTIFSIVLLAAIASCGKTGTVNIQSTSANGKVKIELSAERKLPLDPYTVDLKVKAYNQEEGKLRFEIGADELSPSNVNFKWDESKHCIITITERDNHIRTFELLASENQLQLAEVNN